MRRQPTALILSQLDPRKFGSFEEYLARVSATLSGRGWKVVVVFARPLQEPVLSRFQGCGAEFDVLLPAAKPTYYWRLLRLLWKHRPDVVHFHFFEQFSVTPLVGSLARPRLMVFTDHFRLPNPLGLLTRLQLRLWNRTVLRFLRVRMLAVSRHVKKVLVDGYYASETSVGVAYNGVNTERFVPVAPGELPQLRTDLGLPLDKTVVLCVAALIPEKGVGDLLQAVPLILAGRPATGFVIVGEGPLAASLQQQAHVLGIAPYVRFTGMRSDVNRLMAAADVVVVPSVWAEPAGLATIEAMAAGRPVVATRVGGIPEHLEDGVSGILVDPHAPQQIASAVLRLLAAPQEAAGMGAAGRKRVQEHFSLERWITDTAQLYEHG